MTINYISPASIRNWCLKYGLYCLLRPIPIGKYALILDESVEIDNEHLLVLLAVPIGQSSPIAPLGFSDTIVLALKVQPSWKSKEIAELIKRQQDMGIEIAYGISDGCPTLKKALSICSISWVSDCTHEMANRAKALFKNDKTFLDFTRQLNSLRAKWILSKHRLYVPPTLRSKSRFHQLFVVHKWGNFILQKWESIPKEAQEALQFVKTNLDLIKELEHFYFLITGFSNIFKQSGIQENSIAKWKKLTSDLMVANDKIGIKERVKSFIHSMDVYLLKQQTHFEENTQILCCSDVIESTFGKYKNKGGMKMITEDVLQIATYADKNEMEEVKKAMEQTKTVQVQEWKKQNTTVSKLAKLTRAKKKFKEKSAA